MTEKDTTTFRPLARKDQDRESDLQSVTETIDLTSMFTPDVSSSGSFDLRGLRVSTVGKLLDAIPIPALLVGSSCVVMFANQACRKISVQKDQLLGMNFASLFLDSGAGIQAESAIEKAFNHKIPLVFEALVGSAKSSVQGRLHLRPIKVGRQRAVMVIIEDMGGGKKSP
jgi:two-component system, cell cycle sensor histidine kinase and response regulator CckA